MTVPHSQEEAMKIIYEVYAKAMVDREFYDYFVGDPNKALAEYGLRSPEGVYYHLVDAYREGDENLPKSGGVDIYLAYPIPEEEVSFDVLAVVDESGSRAESLVVLGGTLTPTGTGGTDFSGDDSASSDASGDETSPTGPVPLM